MDILLCPICGRPLDRADGRADGAFDCENGCRARDPEAWIRARWEQMNPERDGP